MSKTFSLFGSISPMGNDAMYILLVRNEMTKVRDELYTQLKTELLQEVRKEVLEQIRLEAHRSFYFPDSSAISTPNCTPLTSPEILEASRDSSAN